MDGPRPNNLIAGAICLSLAAHGGLAIVAGTVGVAAGGSAMVGSGHAPPPMLIAWSDDAPPPVEPQPPEAPKPADEPKAEPPPQAELDEPIRLGIAESDLDTDNWMGFEKPTPHSAMKSDVEQPALDPTAGIPAPPGTPSPTPAAGDQAPTPAQPPAPPPLVAPLPVEPPVEVQEQAAQKAETRDAEAATQKPVDAGGLDHSKAEATPPDDRGTPLPEVADPDRPLMLEGTTELEQLAEPLAGGFVGPPFESSEAQTESTESAGVAAHTQPQPPAPPPQPPGSPGKPATIAGPGGTNSPGSVPGEQSDRESDASSLDEPVEVRLGRPAAAKGLEIVTKRPDFSLVTRMTVYPQNNPRLRVTFNREGRVSAAKFVDPTGLSEVDSPVLHAVYRWTARGEALAKLPLNDPKAGVTITVTILLR